MSAENSEDDPPSYEDRFVAFIDILGFSEYVINNSENAELIISNVKNIYDKARFKVESIDEARLSITAFSDSIILSTSRHIIDEDDCISSLYDIIWCVKNIFIFLLESGFLVRGAIVRGKLIHNEKMLLGPALIEAYRLESRSAIFPRVIIQQSVAKMLRREGNRWVIPATDGPYFMHAFKDFEDYILSYKDIGWLQFSKSPVLNKINLCRDKIELILDSSRYNSKHYACNIWLAKYFDDYVARRVPVEIGECIKPILQDGGWL